MESVVSKFGLNIEQTQILYSLQYQIILNDILVEKNLETKEIKKKWACEWKKYIECDLEKLAGNIEDIRNYELYSDLTQLKEDIQKSQKTLNGNNTPLYLILLEVVLFRPFFPLSKEKNKKIKWNEKEVLNLCEKFAGFLGIDRSYVEKFRKAYTKAINSISGKYKNILIGALIGTITFAVAAGFLAGAIALAIVDVGTLTGAAAVSYALAVLGGGAIAAGGFGIAGGIAVVVGGGAILGVGLGSGAGLAVKLLSSPDFALSQAAKLEVVMKEIILGAQRDVRFAQEIFKQHKKAIESLENELFNLKMASGENKQRIKDAEKSIKYLKKEFERMQKFLITLKDSSKKEDAPEWLKQFFEEFEGNKNE
jgi:hypothetical protein